MTARDPYESRQGGRAEIARRVDPVLWGRRLGPLGLAHLEHYERHGYIVIPSLFSLAEVGEVMREAERLAAAADRTRDDVILEPRGDAVRSLFRVHHGSEAFARLAADVRLAGTAQQILDDQVYIHQSRINFKPAFEGEPFTWHSDFETWHVEDGMPRPRALSASLLLTENTPHNGPLLVIPGSHQHYVRCAGATPDDHYKVSLRVQEYGSPDRAMISRLAEGQGVAAVTGPPGTVVFFDCNLLHASSGNVTPMPRHNVFLVYNSVANAVVEPFGTQRPRPLFLAERTAVALAARS